MGLTKPNQQLLRDLRGRLQPGTVLCRLASRLDGADAFELMRLYEDADELVGYADEVKTGNVAEKTDNKSSPEPGFSFLSLTDPQLT